MYLWCMCITIFIYIAWKGIYRLLNKWFYKFVHRFFFLTTPRRKYLAGITFYQNCFWRLHLHQLIGVVCEPLGSQFQYEDMLMPKIKPFKRSSLIKKKYKKWFAGFKANGGKVKWRKCNRNWGKKCEKIIFKTSNLRNHILLLVWSHTLLMKWYLLRASYTRKTILNKDLFSIWHKSLSTALLQPFQHNLLLFMCHKNVCKRHFHSLRSMKHHIST